MARVTHAPPPGEDYNPFLPSRPSVAEPFPPLQLPDPGINVGVSRLVSTTRAMATNTEETIGRATGGLVEALKRRQKYYIAGLVALGATSVTIIGALAGTLDKMKQDPAAQGKNKGKDCGPFTWCGAATGWGPWALGGLAVLVVVMYAAGSPSAGRAFPAAPRAPPTVVVAGGGGPPF